MRGNALNNQLSEKVTTFKSDVDNAAKKLEFIKTQMNFTGETINGLKSEVSKKMKTCEMAYHTLNGLVHGQTSTMLPSMTGYFDETLNEFEQRIQTTQQTLFELNSSIDSLIHANPPNPETISKVIQHQHQSFLALASKVSHLHQQINQISVPNQKASEKNLSEIAKKVLVPLNK
ncbi:hypothetical protein ROZALSC1DRAFT_27724 [Rozella allomycis CSF55]|uniref:Uncharacterized protein n=1 Tax=Rozella allomycis (strain CSF55) TaxID=988480 RepID=A0A075AWM9_ROZAC|nr:hypothetical protein O9G_004107 [Rozella allomycis CSF55]RKP20811.1 hypothetical protein ROZALSC1DRAFT_27724 [Rozella allomycis CSF55]|eukprot:EPZ34740.1 hypothetical protein O9G_004107 [Rozella allomycis CSF55]